MQDQYRIFGSKYSGLIFLFGFRQHMRPWDFNLDTTKYYAIAPMARKSPPVQQNRSVFENDFNEEYKIPLSAHLYEYQSLHMGIAKKQSNIK